MDNEFTVSMESSSVGLAELNRQLKEFNKDSANASRAMTSLIKIFREGGDIEKSVEGSIGAFQMHITELIDKGRKLANVSKEFLGDEKLARDYAHALEQVLNAYEQIYNRMGNKDYSDTPEGISLRWADYRSIQNATNAWNALGKQVESELKKVASTSISLKTIWDDFKTNLSDGKGLMKSLDVAGGQFISTLGNIGPGVTIGLKVLKEVKEVVEQLVEDGMGLQDEIVTMDALFGNGGFSTVEAMHELEKSTSATKDEMTQFLQVMHTKGLNESDAIMMLETTIDLANVNGTSFRNMASAVESSMSGQTRTIKKYLPNMTEEMVKGIDITKTSGEEVIKTWEQIGETVKGASKEIADSKLSQQLKNIKDSWQYFKEQAGLSIVLDLVNLDIFQWVVEQLDKWAGGAEKKNVAKSVGGAVKSMYDYVNLTSIAEQNGYDNPLLGIRNEEGRLENKQFETFSKNVRSDLDKKLYEPLDAYISIMKEISLASTDTEKMLWEEAKSVLLGVLSSEEMKTIFEYNRTKDLPSDITDYESDTGSSKPSYSSDYYKTLQNIEKYAQELTDLESDTTLTDEAKAQTKADIEAKKSEEETKKRVFDFLGTTDVKSLIESATEGQLKSYAENADMYRIYGKEIDSALKAFEKDAPKEYESERKKLQDELLTLEEQEVILKEQLKNAEESERQGLALDLRELGSKQLEATRKLEAMNLLGTTDVEGRIGGANAQQLIGWSSNESMSTQFGDALKDRADELIDGMLDMGIDIASNVDAQSLMSTFFNESEIKEFMEKDLKNFTKPLADMSIAELNSIDSALINTEEKRKAFNEALDKAVNKDLKEFIDSLKGKSRDELLSITTADTVEKQKALANAIEGVTKRYESKISANLGTLSTLTEQRKILEEDMLTATEEEKKVLELSLQELDASISALTSENNAYLSLGTTDVDSRISSASDEALMGMFANADVMTSFGDDLLTELKNRLSDIIDNGGQLLESSLWTFAQDYLSAGDLGDLANDDIKQFQESLKDLTFESLVDFDKALINTDKKQNEYSKTLMKSVKTKLSSDDITISELEEMLESLSDLDIDTSEMEEAIIEKIVTLLKGILGDDSITSEYVKSMFPLFKKYGLEKESTDTERSKFIRENADGSFGGLMNLFGRDDTQGEAWAELGFGELSSETEMLAGVMSGFGDNVKFIIDIIRGGNPFIMALMEVAKGFVKEISPMLEAVLQPLFDALHLIGAQLADMFLPILEALAPIIQMIADIVTRSLAPILKLLTNIMEVFGGVIRAVAYALTYVAEACELIWEAFMVIPNIVSYIVGWVGQWLRHGFSAKKANEAMGDFETYVAGDILETLDSYDQYRSEIYGEGTANDPLKAKQNEENERSSASSYSGGNTLHFTLNISDTTICGDRGIDEFTTIMMNAMEEKGYFKQS